MHPYYAATVTKIISKDIDVVLSSNTRHHDLGPGCQISYKNDSLNLKWYNCEIMIDRKMKEVVCQIDGPGI